MLFRRILPCLFFLLSPVIGSAQQAVHPSARYSRLICLVHLTGTGKPNDPVRPEYTPTAAQSSREGILAWRLQLTDDKKMAIIHLVAVNRHAFDTILADKRPDIRVFEIGTHDKKTIEQELRQYRKDFDLDSFQVVAQ